MMKYYRIAHKFLVLLLTIDYQGKKSNIEASMPIYTKSTKIKKRMACSFHFTYYYKQL